MSNVVVDNNVVQIVFPAGCPIDASGSPKMRLGAAATAAAALRRRITNIAMRRKAA